MNRLPIKLSSPSHYLSPIPLRVALPALLASAIHSSRVQADLMNYEDGEPVRPLSGWATNLGLAARPALSAALTVPLGVELGGMAGELLGKTSPEGLFTRLSRYNFPTPLNVRLPSWGQRPRALGSAIGGGLALSYVFESARDSLRTAKEHAAMRRDLASNQ